MEVTAPCPVSREQLVRVHLASYVGRILDYSLPNGFGYRSAQVAASLPRTCGAMLNACWAALPKVARKIGILDLDMHWGNGTQHIIDKLDLAKQVPHYSRHFQAGEAERFLQGLAQEMKTQFTDCDLLIYQAGADCHIHDPLGG